MVITVRSFAKINLGLGIGALRADGFHELRTVYQTIGLHDVIRVSVGLGSGIEICCDDSRVPTDKSNTCYRIVERAMASFKARGRVVLEIEKRLPVQGGLGGASGNAVAALLGLERALKKKLSGPERLRIAAAVGSDLPLFLVGGTVLGVGRGEEVYPLPDLPAIPCVVATPDIGVSTPKAFADWDLLVANGPQGIKPDSIRASGTAEAVPFPNLFMRPVLVALELICTHVATARILWIGAGLATLIGFQPMTETIRASARVASIHRWAARMQGHSHGWSAIVLEASKHGIDVVQITRSVEGTRAIAAEIVALRGDAKAVRTRVIGDNAVLKFRSAGAEVLFNDDTRTTIPADGAVSDLHRTRFDKDGCAPARAISCDGAVSDGHFT
jgi:4-diphosphocytidyl-2C-methyl-D-erythritol kinase